jgi:iron complex outermembrane receptor protein
MTSLARWSLLLSASIAGPLPAAAAPDALELDRVQVTSARLAGVAPFDVPASISRVVLDDDRNRADVNLSDALGGVPGLLARDRQNYAQDTQLSIRGFGARSTFGVRGLRLYSDGIPATMPDGQGQVSHFSLAGAERIEVLRGPFSALHGNSSGGVLELWSADGGAREARVQATLGAYDSASLAARLSGGGERGGYNVAASAFDTDGFRDHSATRRESANAKLHLDVGGSGRLDLLANHFDSPDAQDPLGLTRTQAQSDPSQATSVATQFDTRKSARQDQLGAVWTQSLGSAQTLRVLAYGGQRAIEQFLALPVGAQGNPLNSGGVVDLSSDYDGADARWSWQGEFAGRSAEFTVGASGERQRQQRRGYENFVGDHIGTRGALRRDERNQVRSLDQYAQAWWQFAPRWSLLAGARHSHIAFRSQDRYVRAGNPDDSGRVDYGRTTPVAGISFAPRDDLRVYASSGRGFETPTFNELGYRADGGAGLALDLRPATSRNLELGAKWRSARGSAVELALFRADTDDELAVARNVGGRSSFRNVGRARRQGVELSWRTPLRDTLDLDVAVTRLDAAFRDTFPICTATGCTTPTQTVAAGTRIPGTARDQLFARLQWRPGAWQAAVELAAVSDVSVNDIGSERAPGHALVNLELARAWRPGNTRLRTFARIDNALDRNYFGSVIVNEGNARYYEPGPGRTLLLGAQWVWAP